jgi:hypothetical protein
MTAPLVRLLADFDPLKYEQARRLRYYEAIEGIEDIIKKRIR